MWRAVWHRLEVLVMRKLLKDINTRYDRLSEPKRFATFLAVVLPGVFAIHNAAPAIVLAGVVYLLVVVAGRLIAFYA